jgi:hypothetical protein
MSNTTAVLLRSCWLAGLLTATAAGQSATPKPPQVYEDQEQLLTSQRREVDKLIGWWKNRLLRASSAEDVVTVRKGLLGHYNFYDNQPWKTYYADQATKQLKDVLTGKALKSGDTRGELKQINAAMAVADMKHQAVQPALELLVASENQALRYFGWRGYEAIQPQILSADKPLETLLASLKRAISTETNPLILKLVFRTADLPDNARLSRSTRAKVRSALLDALAGAWPTYRKNVAGDSDPQALQAVTEAVNVLGELGGQLRQDAAEAGGEDKQALQARWTRSLQLLADMTDTAAQAWLDRAGQPQGFLKPMEDLLLACEAGLQASTGSEPDRLKQAVTAGDDVVGNREAAVLRANLKWLAELKPLGVKQPAAPAGGN